MLYLYYSGDKSENKFSDMKFVACPQKAADILLRKNAQTSS